MNRSPVSEPWQSEPTMPPSKDVSIALIAAASTAAASTAVASTAMAAAMWRPMVTAKEIRMRWSSLTTRPGPAFPLRIKHAAHWRWHCTRHVFSSPYGDPVGALNSITSPVALSLGGTTVRRQLFVSSVGSTRSIK